MRKLFSIDNNWEKKIRELKAKKAVNHGVKIRLPKGLSREIGNPQLKNTGKARMVINNWSSRK